jgi:RNA polymerase subunit RPABC4/transcription elongation factor Spt4
MLPSNKKICKDCKYFIGDTNKCKYFYETNLVNGDKTYKYAEIMRKYDDECGEDAKYFEINENKIFTVPYYFLKSNWSLIIVSFFTCLYCYALIITK